MELITKQKVKVFVRRFLNALCSGLAARSKF